MTKLNEVIGYDFRANTFVVGTHALDGTPAKGNDVKASYAQADVDALLRQVFSGGDKGQHELLAAQIVEPIMKVVPYMEMYGMFFTEQTYGPIDDNAIPVEDLVAIAFQTSVDGEVMFVRAGYSWTRPTWQGPWDVGIEVQWDSVTRAGWNFLARQMKYAAWELARKRDAAAKAVLDAAILGSHTYSVATTLQRTTLNSVIKAQNAIGFPVTKCLINTGTLVDMAEFTWPTGFLTPPDVAKELIRTLHLGEYGGLEWFASPHAPANRIYLGGDPSMIGYHQKRGEVKQASDIDIRRKVDLHAIYDQEHAWYVENALPLAVINIT